MVLVGGVPDRHARVEAGEQGAGVVAGDGALETQAARALHDGFEQGVLVLAVQHVEGGMQRQQPAAQFQGGEMRAQQDHPAAFGARLLQVLEAHHPDPVLERGGAAPPGQRRLDHPFAQRVEVRLQQTLALIFASIRKAQPQIHRGDMAAPAGQPQRQRADQAAGRHLPAERQPGHQPQHAEHQPGGPEAWSDKTQPPETGVFSPHP